MHEKTSYPKIIEFINFRATCTYKHASVFLKETSVSKMVRGDARANARRGRTPAEKQGRRQADTQTDK